MHTERDLNTDTYKDGKIKIEIQIKIQIEIQMDR